MSNKTKSLGCEELYRSPGFISTPSSSTQLKRKKVKIKEMLGLKYLEKFRRLKIKLFIHITSSSATYPEGKYIHIYIYMYIYVIFLVMLTQSLVPDVWSCFYLDTENIPKDICSVWRKNVIFLLTKYVSTCESL